MSSPISDKLSIEAQYPTNEDNGVCSYVGKKISHLRDEISQCDPKTLKIAAISTCAVIAFFGVETGLVVGAAITGKTILTGASIGFPILSIGGCLCFFKNRNASEITFTGRYHVTLPRVM